MQKNSTSILEILKLFIWLYTIILSIGLFILILLIFTTILGIDIGSMKEIKISVNIGNENIKNIQSLEKGRLLFLLVYSVVLGTMELIMLRYVIKILQKIKLNHPFTIENYFLISRIAKLALAIGCLSFLINFIAGLVTGKLSISFDSGNENFRFFLFAGVVYIIAQVYKKAVDLQSENDLTI
ncbi:DUF2975 domain-containing protein [Chryseobacterium chendengshani]|uniref:DUF2975 domain-containing protein n=1 Tax=Chryseobacterium sp. LJ756 TaxID=2864113 RepID=UPI001C63E526|nr:DUF2975 domain-containing protein [Chryseobacterium sp. LJ756]MBW7675800.1 DUF2975 domain-containing protein [Chryseobacterium sp. LJ756]